MKNFKNLASLSVAAITVATASSVYAGAGATVYACINLATKPINPYTVTITAGGSGTHCMNDSGSDKTFTADSVGLNCVSVGYVESKASSTKGDLCATDKSTWPLGYSIADTSYSGSMVSQWSVGNSISLNTYTKNTVVCNNEALCDSTSADWNKGTQGPLYTIFQPQAN